MFKGKDPQVSPAVGGQEQVVPFLFQGSVDRGAELGSLAPAERLSQLHQDAAAAE